MFVLDRLWKGEISPCERCYREHGQAQKLSKELSDKSGMLNSLMPEELRKLWDDYTTTWDKLEWFSTQDAYFEGIRFGILLMLDVLSGNNENYINKEERT